MEIKTNLKNKTHNKLKQTETETGREKTKQKNNIATGKK
jgi:hypothetical protein